MVCEKVCAGKLYLCQAQKGSCQITHLPRRPELPEGVRVTSCPTTPGAATACSAFSPIQSGLGRMSPVEYEDVLTEIDGGLKGSVHHLDIEKDPSGGGSLRR